MGRVVCESVREDTFQHALLPMDPPHSTFSLPPVPSPRFAPFPPPAPTANSLINGTLLPADNRIGLSAHDGHNILLGAHHPYAKSSFQSQFSHGWVKYLRVQS